MNDTQERGELGQSKKKDTDAMEKSESPRADTDRKMTDDAKETLYKALKNIGINNITTLVNRLGLMPKGYARSIEAEPASAKKPPDLSHARKRAGEREHSSVQDNAKALLRLMRLDPNPDNVLLLEKIGLQGREMLGELPRATITSTPVRTDVEVVIPDKKITGKNNKRKSLDLGSNH